MTGVSQLAQRRKSKSAAKGMSGLPPKPEVTHLCTTQNIAISFFEIVCR